MRPTHERPAARAARCCSCSCSQTTYTIRRAMNLDELDATASLVVDAVFGSELASTQAARVKLTHLRQQQAVLRVQARDARRFFVIVAEENDTIVGCAHLKLQREDEVLKTKTSAKSSSTASTPDSYSTSPFSSMGSFASFLVYGTTRHRPVAQDERRQEEEGDDGDVLYVSNLCVKESARRRGIARAILGALRAEAESRDVPRLYAHVNANNTGARLLYDGLGFENLGQDERGADAADAQACVLLLRLCLRERRAS